jgi:general stress protein 26
MESKPVPLREIVAVAQPIVERIVWSTVTTVSADGEPRTRIMHPVWQWTGSAPVALVSAKRTPIKTRHIASNPRVSCAYWDPTHDTVVIDATAAWIAPDELSAAWEAVKAVPEPVGFDPATVWPDGPTSPGVGFLKFTARRVVTTQHVTTSLRWSLDPAR